MDNCAQKDQWPDRKYSRIVNKVQKGFTAAYPTQSSIPFKYKSSVIPESEKKGFNSQAKRFYHKTHIRSPASNKNNSRHHSLKPTTETLPDFFSENRRRKLSQDNIPGPGSYDVIHQSPVSNSVSLSKKGTCTFPSTCARMDTIISKYPAANAYTIPSRFVSKKDFSNSCSSMFQLPSFVKVLKFETPAPNHYNSSNKHPGRSQMYTASVSFCKQKNNVTARAGFTSKTQRGFFSITERGPAPGHYNINESLVKSSPKILMSCFKSKTGRGFKVTSTGPGPGYYNPHDHVKTPAKTVIPSNPVLNFSASPLPLPPKPPHPGPGQYEIVDYTGPPKHFASSAAFVSHTSRWAAAPPQAGLPGPATYQPEFPGKQSFLYNEDNKWIPVL